MRLMRESLILVVIGLLDLLSTVVLVHNRTAVEANPIMSYYLQLGIGVFVLVKLVLLFFPVFVAEFAKNYRPRFVRLMLRGAIALYLTAYITVFISTNFINPTVRDASNTEPPPMALAERQK